MFFITFSLIVSRFLIFIERFNPKCQSQVRCIPSKPSQWFSRNHYEFDSAVSYSLTEETTWLCLKQSAPFWIPYCVHVTFILAYLKARTLWRLMRKTCLSICDGRKNLHCSATNASFNIAVAAFLCCSSCFGGLLGCWSTQKTTQLSHGSLTSFSQESCTRSLLSKYSLRAILW